MLDPLADNGLHSVVIKLNELGISDLGPILVVLLQFDFLSAELVSVDVVYDGCFEFGGFVHFRENGRVFGVH